MDSVLRRIANISYMYYKRFLAARRTFLLFKTLKTTHLQKCFLKKTRGSWPTSLTWETVPANKHICAWYDYSITLIVREKRHFRSPFWQLNGHYLFKAESSSSNGALWSVWLKLAHAVFLRKRFLNFVNVFSQFCIYLRSERGVELPLNKLESPLPENVLCQVWLKSVHNVVL